MCDSGEVSGKGLAWHGVGAGNISTATGRAFNKTMEQRRAEYAKAPKVGSKTVFPEDWDPVDASKAGDGNAFRDIGALLRAKADEDSAKNSQAGLGLSTKAAAVVSDGASTGDDGGGGSDATAATTLKRPAATEGAGPPAKKGGGSIDDHVRKRKIEAQVFELRCNLEDEEVDEAEIEKRCSKFREDLFDAE